MSPAASAVLLGLAWFCAVNAAVSLLCTLGAARLDDRGRETRRIPLLLALRLLPATISIAVAVCLFVPVHLRLEPANPGERFAPVAYVLAAVALALIVRSAWRLVSLASAAARLNAMRGRAVVHQGIPCTELPMTGGITLAGVFRPRILLDERARAALSDGELEVALAHELAHGRARDNLARVLMWCSPDFLGLVPAGRRIETLWTAASEYRADAHAAAGEPGRAAQLAAALVKVARLGRPRGLSVAPLCSTFNQPALLETRVRLLLNGAPVAPPHTVGLRSGILGLAAALTAAWMFDLPVRLHQLTEALFAR